MSDSELLAQMNNSLIILVIALILMMVIGFALVLFDKNRTHKTQLEYGYNALPPTWQGLLRALVLKAKDATDYLDDATDGVVGGRPITDPQKIIERLTAELAAERAKNSERILKAIPAEPDTRPESERFGSF